MLMAELSPGRASDWLEIWTNCFAIATDDALERGLPEQSVQLITRSVEGLPTGSANDVVGAWNELWSEGVVAVLGPSNADNGMAVRTSANERQTPTMLFGCSEQLASAWTFSVPWGAAAEDIFLAMSWVHHQGHRRVALLWDTAWHGEEWFAYAAPAAERFGVEIVDDARIDALVVGDAAKARQLDAARAGVAKVRAAGADAIVMMTSHAAVPFATALQELGWAAPRVIAGGSFGAARRLPALFEGWVGSCLWDDSNLTCAEFLRQYEKRFGTRPPEDMAIAVYDGCRALLEGMRLAPAMTREGIRTGLERVKRLSAASGAPSTVLSFGPHDHRGYKGRDTSVLRRQLTASRDGCVFEGYYRDPA